MSDQTDQEFREQKDDALQLESDLAQVIGAPTPVVHRAVAAYTFDTGDNYTTLMLALYWLYREHRHAHAIYQRFQSYLSEAHKEK
jgi:hypothetical protein